MTTFLLDVNVLVALLDPMHVQHDSAHEWFAEIGYKSWASCPLTQNGVVRVIGHARYPNSPGSPAAVAPLIVDLCALQGHVYWPDDISLLNARIFDTSRLLNSTQVTDSYLLGLALAHQGKLATFDRRMVVDGVIDGAAALHVIQ